MDVVKFLKTVILSLFLTVPVAFGAEQTLFDQAKELIGKIAVEQIVTDEMIVGILEEVTDAGEPFRADMVGIVFWNKTRDLRKPADELYFSETEPDYYSYTKVGGLINAAARSFMNDPNVISSIYGQKLPVVMQWLLENEGTCARQTALMKANGRVWTCQSASIMVRQQAEKFRSIFEMFRTDEKALTLMKSYLDTEYPLQLSRLQTLSDTGGEYPKEALLDNTFIESVMPSAKHGWYNGHTPAEAEYWKAREELEQYFVTDYETVSFVFRFVRALDAPAADKWQELMNHFIAEL